MTDPIKALASLLSRIRPGVEAAPWVVDELSAITAQAQHRPLIPGHLIDRIDENGVEWTRAARVRDMLAQPQPAPTDATTPPSDDYDALDHAMKILGGCVTPYSCEQAQAVAKVLRQWRDKWALAVDSIPVAKPAPTDAYAHQFVGADGMPSRSCVRCGVDYTTPHGAVACRPPAPTDAEIEAAVDSLEKVVHTYTINTTTGRISCPDRDVARANLLALIARLRGGAS